MGSRSFRGVSLLGAIVGLLAVGACARSLEDRLAEIRALHRSRQIQASIPLLIDLIESGVEDGEVYYRYGRALDAVGQPERSIWALDAAMDDPKWRVRAGQQIAIGAARSKNFELGLQVLERLERERPDGEEVELPELLLHARMLVETNRRYEEALEILEEVLDRSPDEDEAIRLKAASLLGLSRPDEAYEVIRSAGIAPEPPPSPEGDGKPGDAPEGSQAIADEAAPEDAGGDQDERDAYWCAIRASFQRESRQLEKATESIEECLARHPASIALINEAVKVYGPRKPRRIVEVLKSAYEASPDEPHFLRVLVDSYVSSGRFEDAEAVLRDRLEVLRANPKGPRGQLASIWSDLAGFLIARHRIDEALEAFHEVTALLGDDIPPALRLRYADTLIVAGRYDEALAVADRSPVEIHRSMLHGRIAFEQGHYPEALKVLDEAALQWPDNAPIHYYLARAAEGLGDFDRAVEEYRQAIRSDATLSAARERLTRLHLAEGKAREAAMIVGFRSPKEKSEPSMIIRILAVEVNSRLGRDVKLDFPFEPGADPETVHLEIARALARGNRARLGASQGESVLETLEAKVAPNLKGSILRERVGLLLEVGEVDKAIAVATRGSVAARAGDPNVQVALARALIRREASRGEGETLLHRLRDQRPLDAEIWRVLGETEASRGNAAEAARCWEEALRLAPDDWLAMKSRIEQLVGSGQREEAIQRLTAFLHQVTYSGEAALALATLEADDPGRRAEAIALTLRAVRFEGGEPAIEVLSRLDPSAAARLAPATKQGVPKGDPPAIGVEAGKDKPPETGSAS